MPDDGILTGQETERTGKMSTKITERAAAARQAGRPVVRARARTRAAGAIFPAPFPAGLMAAFLAGLLAILVAGAPAPARAQLLSWIQIEARPSLREAEARARGYSARLPDVNGFAIGRGWYAIALGPYAPGEAARRLARLRAEGRIPSDSFVTDGRDFRQRFWPVGPGALAPAGNEPTRTPQQPPATGAGEGSGEGGSGGRPQDPPAGNAPAAAPQAGGPSPDELARDSETPRAARASEARLTREERMELQRALQWAGHYKGGIDGAFGRGTRAAMRAWQAQKGLPATGILTTAQRRALLREYRRPLEEAGMKPVRDVSAGIEIKMPLALVKFTRYAPPLSHYDSRGDSGVRVFLISQRGDEAALTGLYEVLQSLAIIPPEGTRSLGRGEFVIEGADGKITSHAEARLADGLIKGFILLWPAGDETRRQRVLEAMRASFSALPGASLDDLPRPPGADQGPDLVAGLEIRKPRLSRSGFFVDGTGRVLTSLDAAAECARITLDDEHEARLAAADPAHGLALLAPAEPLAPAAHARLRILPPRPGSEISVAGYSYEGLLDAPSLTFGRLAGLRGLDGEAWLYRLDIAARPGDAGGPVLGQGGGVLGLLLPRPQDDGRRLPEGVHFAARAGILADFLSENGITPPREPTGETAGEAARGTGKETGEETLHPEDLAAIARDLTVLVSCWE